MFLNELRGFITRGIYTINSIILDGVSETELILYRDLFNDIGVAEITYLLDRILSINMNHIEIELMRLGYQGIEIPKENKTDIAPLLNTASIIEISNELTKENKEADSNIKKLEAISVEKGIANAVKITESADIDSILLMGGTVIE